MTLLDLLQNPYLVISFEFILYLVLVIGIIVAVIYIGIAAIAVYQIIRDRIYQIFKR